MIKHSLVIKHFMFYWLVKWYQTCLNEQNVFFSIFDQIFDVVQLLSNTIKKGFQAKKGWSPNNVWSCFIAKHFPFWSSILYLCALYSSQHRFSSLLWNSKMRSVIVCQTIQSADYYRWKKLILQEKRARAYCYMYSFNWSSSALERKMKGKINGKG